MTSHWALSFLPSSSLLLFQVLDAARFLTSLVLAAILPVAFAADCQNSGGVANGECVKFYGNSECKGSPIGSYKPTCGGNCFQYNSFGSVFVSGDGTYGTDCVLYSDDNCSVEQTVSLRPGCF